MVAYSTSNKAKAEKILKHDKVNEKPSTKKQKRYKGVAVGNTIMRTKP